MTQGWTGLRTAVVALGLLVLSAPGVKADGLLGYSVAGAVTDTGVTGANVISFVPVNGMQEAGISSGLSLGTFQVSALPAGMTTTYDNTPFEITLSPTSYDGTALTGTSATYVELTGVLNGTVTGASETTGLTATFNTTSLPTFTFLGASTNVLGSGAVTLVPSTSNSGMSTVEATIMTTGTPTLTPAPEPSTVALFLSTFGGLGLRRYVLRRRTQAAA